MKQQMVLLIFSCALACSCSTTPTGRKQLKYMPEKQMSQMGDSAYQQMKQEKKVLPTHSAPHQRVECITQRLLKVMGQDPNKWEISVIQDPSPNAFALPGQNMGVHTGMVDLVENNDQLAAVIGHEIGHVLAHHGNERVSQQMLMQGGLVLADIYLGRDSKTDGLIMAALGMGAQVGIMLPFSRAHETEADEMGLQYMAEAGFNPKQAAELWKLMAKASQGKAPPEFLSTHPTPESRSKNLSKKAEPLMSTYKEQKKQAQACPSGA